MSKAPLSITDEAPRGPRNLKETPILPDIVQWIREGISDTIVATRVHDQGFLNHLDKNTVSKQVGKYRRELPAAQVASIRQSKGVLDAAAVVGGAVDRIGQLAQLAVRQQASLDSHESTVQIFEDLLTRIASGDYDNGDAEDGLNAAGPNSGKMLLTELRTSLNIGDETFPVPIEIAGMNRRDAMIYLVMTSQAMKNHKGNVSEMGKLYKEIRETVATQVELLEKIGLLAPQDATDSEAAIEAEITEYTKVRFKGRRDIQAVFQDPERRNRVMGLAEKLMTRPKIADAIEAHAVVLAKENEPPQPKAKEPKAKRKVKRKAKGG